MPESYTPLSPEQLSRARAKGLELPENPVIDSKGFIVSAPSAPPPAEATVDEVGNPKDYNIWGLAPRSFAKGILPTLAGMATTAVASPVVSPVGGVAAGIGAGMLTTRAQDWVLNQIQKLTPDSVVGSQIQQAKTDAEKHPWLTSASMLPTAVFGGGSFLPSARSILVNPKAAAMMGGLMGGIDVGTQMLANRSIDPRNLDLGQTAIMTLGSPFFAGKGPQVPGKKSTALSPEELAARAKEMGHGVPEVKGDFDTYSAADLNAAPQYLANLSKEATGRGRKAAALQMVKNAGLEITEDVKNRIDNPGKYDPDRIANDIIAEQKVVGAAGKQKTQEYAAQKNKEELARLDIGREVPPAKSAEESAPVLDKAAAERDAADAARQKEMEAGVAAMNAKTQQNPPMTPMSAEEAAAQRSKAEVSDIKSVLRQNAAEKKTLVQLEKQLEEPMDPEARQYLIDYLAEKNREFDARIKAALERTQSPEQPLGVTVEEAARPKEMAPIDMMETEEGATNVKIPVPPKGGQNPPVRPEPEATTKAGNLEYEKRDGVWQEKQTGTKIQDADFADYLEGTIKRDQLMEERAAAEAEAAKKQEEAAAAGKKEVPPVDEAAAAAQNAEQSVKEALFRGGVKEETPVGKPVAPTTAAATAPTTALPTDSPSTRARTQVEPSPQAKRLQVVDNIQRTGGTKGIQNILTTHPNWPDFEAANSGRMKRSEMLTRFFNELSPADKEVFHKTYEGGAKAWDAGWPVDLKAVEAKRAQEKAGQERVKAAVAGQKVGEAGAPTTAVKPKAQKGLVRASASVKPVAEIVPEPPKAETPPVEAPKQEPQTTALKQETAAPAEKAPTHAEILDEYFASRPEKTDGGVTYLQRKLGIKYEEASKLVEEYKRQKFGQETPPATTAVKPEEVPSKKAESPVKVETGSEGMTLAEANHAYEKAKAKLDEAKATVEDRRKMIQGTEDLLKGYTGSDKESLMNALGRRKESLAALEADVAKAQKNFDKAAERAGHKAKAAGIEGPPVEPEQFVPENMQKVDWNKNFGSDVRTGAVKGVPFVKTKTALYFKQGGEWFSKILTPGTHDAEGNFHLQSLNEAIANTKANPLTERQKSPSFGLVEHLENLVKPYADAANELPQGTARPEPKSLKNNDPVYYLTKGSDGEQFPSVAEFRKYNYDGTVKIKLNGRLKDVPADSVLVDKPEMPKGEMIPLKPGESGPAPSDQALGIMPRSMFKDPMTKLSRAIQATTKTIAEKGGELGQRFAKRYEDMVIAKRRMEEPWQKRITDLSKPFSEDERKLAGRWLIDMSREGKSSVNLPPKLQQYAQDVNKLLVELGMDKSRSDSPLVAYITKEGNVALRRFEARKWWFPERYNKDTSALMNDSSRNQTQYEQLREAFIKHHVDRYGSSVEEAEAAFANRANPAVGPTTPNPEFRNLRFEEGIGLPDIAVETDPLRALQAVINKHATDMSYHRNIESDPMLAKGLNLSDNGRGEPIVKDKDAGRLLRIPEVKAALADYTGGLGDATTQKFEKVMGVIHAMKIGPVSQMRNFIQNIGAVQEILLPEERGYIWDATRNAFKKEAFEQALNAGSVRHKRNILSTVAQDANEGMNKVMDVLTRYTGSEAISKANDVFLDQLGRNVAKNRLAIKDARFMDEFGPADWRTKPLNEVIDHAAAKFQRKYSGAYDATDLPPAMLRGSNAWMAPVFKLARWSTGRFNNWHDAVYEPAKKGELKPLLRSLAGAALSAGAINVLSEVITNRKPKELTWSEYLNLGGKDTAYTLFSKAATASYGGLLSDLAFGAVQLANGEAPRSYNNLAFQSISDAATRVGQYANAVSDGTADLSDLATLGISILTDNVQAARVLIDRPEDTGKREEKIARRLDYMPKKGGFVRSLPNPFGESGAYESENTDRLGKILQDKINSGQTPTAPSAEVRTTGIYRNGQYRNYYDFIRQAQGEEAAKKAMDRDINNTIKKQGLFTTAISKVR